MNGIGTIVAGIITSLFAWFIASLKNDNNLHDTINWREKCFNLSKKENFTRADILELRSLVSPMNESSEDCAINALCEHYLKTGLPYLNISHNADFRKAILLLLKLNWLKHGSTGSHINYSPRFIKRYRSRNKLADTTRTELYNIAIKCAKSELDLINNYQAK